MVDLSTLRRSPLHDLADRMREEAVTGDRAVRLTEMPFWAMVNLRVRPGSAAAGRIERALGVSLPAAVGTTNQHDALTALWLGPDEWLLVSQDQPGALTTTLTDALADALGLTAADGNAQVVDVSANRTVVQLDGPGAREVLEKGCPADLHPRVFPDGTAITTTLARVPVLVWKIGAEQYRVLVRPSFAEYVALWLLDATQELGPTTQVGRA